VVKKIAPKKVVKTAVKKAAPKKATQVISKPIAKTIAKKAPVAAVAAKKLEPKKATPNKSKISKVSVKPTIAPKPIKSKKSVEARVETKQVISKAPVFEEKPEELPPIITDSKRYSDDDLNEFKQLINKKLSVAKEELNNLLAQMSNPGINGSSETDNSYNKLEDGASTSEKEYLSQLAARQRKFIENLENALIRIENKTYGICKVTGKLISKERLRAVPHTTLSMEAKLQQYK